MLIVSLSSPANNPNAPIGCVIEQVETGTRAAGLMVDGFLSTAREARANGFKVVVLGVEDLDAVTRIQRYDTGRESARPAIADNLTRLMVETALTSGTVLG